MRIAIIGTGAMGSVYAGLLADAGHDIWAVDLWEDHIAAIRQHGLRISGASGDRTVRLNATVNAADVGRADMVVIATKASGVEQAARSAATILTPGGVVITIQNGLGSADHVAEVIGDDRVIVGIVGGFGASIPAPGHVHHNGWEFVHLGAYRGGTSERLPAVVDVWRSGGFTVRPHSDIDAMVWEKFICNVAFSGTCALTGMTIGQVMEDADAWSVASACAEEAFTVARAKAITLPIEAVLPYVRRFGERIPNARPSMLLDHLARRGSEIDVINGAVPRVAAEVGLIAPVNQTVSALIRAIERQFDRGRMADNGAA